MWNKPHILNAIADLLILAAAAALVVAGAVWLVRVPSLPDLPAGSRVRLAVEPPDLIERKVDCSWRSTLGQVAA